MENNENNLATEVIKLLKQSIKRLYTILIIIIIFFVISIADSIYQRCRIIDIFESIEVVEETVTEQYEMNTDGNNNFVGGDNNGEINNENN